MRVTVKSCRLCVAHLGNRRCHDYYGMSRHVNHCFSPRTSDNTGFIHWRCISSTPRSQTQQCLGEPQCGQLWAERSGKNTVSSQTQVHVPALPLPALWTQLTSLSLFPESLWNAQSTPTSQSLGNFKNKLSLSEHKNHPGIQQELDKCCIACFHAWVRHFFLY